MNWWVQRLGHRVDAVTAVAAVVLVIGAAQLVAGALAAGVTVDEPTHVDRATGWLENGWYTEDGAAPDPDNPLETGYVYGPAWAALAHGANVLAGNESLGEISRSAGAYDVRHLTVAALALLTVAAVGAAVWRLTSSRGFGLWAAAGLLAIPAWTGHAFFNPKDIPAACGYALVSLALILALCEGPSRRASSSYRLTLGAILAGGIFIGAGTRLALWLPFAASLVTYAALRLGQRRLGGIALDAHTDLAVAAGAGAGFAAIAVLYPTAASEPVTLLTESVSGSSDFPHTTVTLTAGHLLSEHVPWWYLPIWIGASVPLLLGALALLGAVLGIRALATVRGTCRHGAIWSRPKLGLLLVFQQALLLPLGAIVTGAPAYHGTRQHLYVLPAIAILAGVGAERFWRWAKARRAQKRWRALAVSVLGAALLVPMAEQTLLFPYNYAYVNPAAGIGGVNDRWETDYLFASAPEALSRTPRTSSLRCGYWLGLPWIDDRPLQERHYWLSLTKLVPCIDDDALAPFEARWGDAVAERWQDDNSAVWLIGRKRAGNRPPDYCEEADTVTRWLRGESVVMSYVFRCDPAEARRNGVRWPRGLPIAPD